MAAEKGKTPGKQARRTTGKGPQSRSAKGAQPAAKTVDVAPRGRSRAEAGKALPADIAAAQAAARERITHITCRQSMFQLRAEREDNIGGRIVPQAGWMLDFGTRGFVVGDAETVAAVESVLAGTWTDGRASGRDFQRNAQKAGLSIVQHGLAVAPLATWDQLADERVVPVAFEAGVLGTVAQIVQAIRYENESLERVPARAPRERVLADLEEVEAVVKGAGGSAPVRAAVAPAASGISTPQAAL